MRGLQQYAKAFLHLLNFDLLTRGDVERFVEETIKETQDAE
jgi:hypothetical protein